MKNVLFIGGYFPEISIESFNNYLLCQECKSKDYDLFLLSDSWYRVNKKEFKFLGNMEELSKLEPFKKKYFIDPIQCKYARNEIYAMLGCLFPFS